MVKTCGEISFSKELRLSKKPFKPDHLELRHQTYFAILYVPKDVQHIIGKAKFFETTGTHDLTVARVISANKIVSWKAAIAEARSRTNDPILKSAIELHRRLQSSPRQLVEEIIEEEAEKIAHAYGKNGPLIAETFHAVATGTSKPLEQLMDAWSDAQERRGLAAKTIAQMKSDIEVLVQHLPTSNLLTSEHTTQWIQLIAKKGALSASSVGRIIGSCRNFYKHLQYINVIPETALQPFTIPKEFIKSKKRNSKSENKTNSWLPFETEDVVKIYQEAKKRGDIALSQLIFVAAYTGARIEELCSLEKASVSISTDSFHITDSKTEAGVRVIPIHSKLKPLMMELMKSDDDKYLFANLTFNKFKDRSNAIGKRFGRLKTSLKYDKRYVFHSIRKTFTTQMENAGVPENVTADIVGHEKPNLTYGLYSGGTTLAVKKNSIIKISYSF